MDRFSEALAQINSKYTYMERPQGRPSDQASRLPRQPRTRREARRLRGRRRGRGLARRAAQQRHSGQCAPPRLGLA